MRSNKRSLARGKVRGAADLKSLEAWSTWFTEKTVKFNQKKNLGDAVTERADRRTMKGGPKKKKKN